MQELKIFEGGGGYPWARLGRVLINRDCSAIAGCRKRRVRIARSGDLPPPSPPGEEATAREHETRQSGAGDGAGDGDLRC
jgi:hypothetical protein